MESKLKVLILAVMLSAPSYAQEIKQNPDGSVTITVSKEEVEQCKAGGGCMLVQMKMIEAVVLETAKHMCGKEA